MLDLIPDAGHALREENERLLHLLVTLQREVRHSRLLAAARQVECDRLRVSQADLEHHLARLTAENADILNRYAAVRRELAGLAEARAAAQRVHDSTTQSHLLLRALDEVLDRRSWPAGNVSRSST